MMFVLMKEAAVVSAITLNSLYLLDSIASLINFLLFQ